MSDQDQVEVCLDDMHGATVRPGTNSKKPCKEAKRANRNSRESRIPEYRDRVAAGLPLFD